MPGGSRSGHGPTPGADVDGVLVVDDSPAVRNRIEESLAKLGVPEHRVTLMDSADDALETFSPMSPDLVLLDTSMPGIDAYDVVQAILLEDPDARIVPLTEKPDDHPSVSELLSFGVFDVLRKPIRTRDLETLFHAIDQERPGAGRIP